METLDFAYHGIVLKKYTFKECHLRLAIIQHHIKEQPHIAVTYFVSDKGSAEE